MSIATANGTAGMLTEQVANVRKFWGWFLALGICQLIVGTLAVGFAFVATLATVMTLGILLILAAGAQMAAAILARDWRGFFLFLLLGILYLVTGFVLLQRPLAAAEGLTLLLSACLMVAGTIRIVVALAERFHSWGWVLLNGVIAVALGFAILQQWPESGLWVIGLFVGIDRIVNGVTWSMLALGVRNGLALARPVTPLS